MIEQLIAEYLTFHNIAIAVIALVTSVYLVRADERGLIGQKKGLGCLTTFILWIILQIGLVFAEEMYLEAFQ